MPWFATGRTQPRSNTTFPPITVAATRSESRLPAPRRAAPPARTGRRAGPASTVRASAGRSGWPKNMVNAVDAPRRIRRRRGRRRCGGCDAPRRASPPTGRRRRTACRWTALPAPRPAAARPRRHSSCCSSAGTSSRYWSPRSATKLGCVTTVTPSSTRSAEVVVGHDGRVLDAVARVGARRRAAPTRVTTSCAAVTQCTATGPSVGVAVDDPRGELVQVEVGRRAGCACPGPGSALAAAARRVDAPPSASRCRRLRGPGWRR